MQDRVSDLSATPAKSGLPALAFMLTTENLQIKQSDLERYFASDNSCRDSLALIVFHGVVSPVSVTTGQ